MTAVNAAERNLAEQTSGVPPYRPEDASAFWVGLGWALTLSVPMWAAIFLAVRTVVRTFA